MSWIAVICQPALTMAVPVQISLCRLLSRFQQVIPVSNSNVQTSLKQCRYHSTLLRSPVCCRQERTTYHCCKLLQVGPHDNKHSQKLPGIFMNKGCGDVKSYTSSVRTDKGKLAKAMPIKRTGRKKPLHEDEDITEYRNVVAYAVGEELELTSLKSDLIREGVYDKLPLPNDIMDCIMATANFRLNGNPRDAFFFSDGGVVCWNMSESERNELVRFAMKHASRAYEMDTVTADSEMFNIQYDKKSGIVKETIHLKVPEDMSQFNEELALHKFAFSNALAQSVNVSVNESNLDKFIEQLEPETQRLRFGQNSKLKKRDIEMKQGEVFLLRHEINLETGLLDTPDIYWERDELEQLYKDTINYLTIPKRIRIINERLTYCSEILSLFSDQINDRHHIRLEWIIIILIFIEVIFGIIALGDRYAVMKAKVAEDKHKDADIPGLYDDTCRAASRTSSKSS